MHGHFTLFAQSFFGGTFEWIMSGVQETATFMRDWMVARFNAQVFGIITIIVVIFAILARINSGRRF
jgi:hypothetical protein